MVNELRLHFTFLFLTLKALHTQVTITHTFILHNIIPLIYVYNMYLLIQLISNVLYEFILDRSPTTVVYHLIWLAWSHRCQDFLMTSATWTSFPVDHLTPSLFSTWELDRKVATRWGNAGWLVAATHNRCLYIILSHEPYIGSTGAFPTGLIVFSVLNWSFELNLW